MKCLIMLPDVNSSFGEYQLTLSDSIKYVFMWSQHPNSYDEYEGSSHVFEITLIYVLNVELPGWVWKINTDIDINEIKMFSKQ